MKKFLKILALTICILMTSACVFARDSATKLRDDIIVQLNGEIIDFTDANGDKVEAQIMNDRTMVPMRKIFEVLGAEVEWDGENRIVTGKKEDTEIKLQIGNNIATKKISEETKNIELDVTPTIVNGRTLVPVRFIAESLDKKVGWDAENRAVIIIDSDEIENKIKNNASNLYELLTNKFEDPKTYEADLVLNGTIKDSEQSKIKGNMNIKVNETAVEIHLNLNSDEKDFKDIDASVILDIKNYTVYVKSDSIKNSDGMWVKYEFDDEEKESMKRVFDELKKSQELDTKYIFNNLIDEKNFTLDFYKELNQIVEMVTKVAGNDNLKKSGNTKYEFSMDMDDLINAMSTQMSSIEILALKAKYAFNMTLDFEINNNIATKSNFSLAIGNSKQKLELDLKATLKNYNKSIKIQYPSSKDVITSEELERKNAEAVVPKMQFSLFTTQLGGLREAVQTAITTAKGEEAIRGNARSNAQLANFVARGGYEAVTEEGWLNQAEAENLSCTLIVPQYAKDVLEIELPNISVKVSNNKEEQVSYYVTPKGQVFGWPPYEYDGKSYVTGSVTVKDELGEELSNFKAIQKSKVIIYFKDTKEVIIVKNGAKTRFEKGSLEDIEILLRRENSYKGSDIVLSSDFKTGINQLQECVQTTRVKAKGDEAIIGNARSNAQLANFVARGGYEVLTKDEKGDKLWLVQSDADSLPCTQINKKYAGNILGAELPTIKVKTYKGANQELSYFVTPKGQVFCWPPYIENNKSYVTSTVTVKKGITLTSNAEDYKTAAEYKRTEATKAEEVVLYFPDTNEYVVVSNRKSDIPLVAVKGNVNGDTKIGVWYKNSTLSSSDEIVRGVAMGIDFSKYNNVR